VSLSSCLYAGTIMHRRLRPRMHRFRYRAWWLMVDVADLPELCKRTRLLAHNRFNMFSIHDRDYASGQGDLFRDISARLSRAGVAVGTGRVFLLTTPRILGYAFNPLSIYLCTGADGTIAAVVYEVHNTYSERHSYVLPARGSDSGIVRQAVDKAFYVSPFLPMQMHYAFRLRPPGERVTLAITASAGDGPILHASMEGERRPLNDTQLLRIFVAQPLATLKVIAAIHWEALRLWLKGLRIVARPRLAPTPTGGPVRSEENFHA
jgi:DUF1365 family protein